MYTFSENFCVFGADGQPAGIEVERSSNFPHLHSRAMETGYALSCLGNRHLLTTPSLSDFSLELESYCTYADLMPADIGIFWHYDPASRRGLELGLCWDKAGKVRLALFDFEVLERRELREVAVLDVPPSSEEHRIFLKLTVSGPSLTGTLNDLPFSCTDLPVGCGRIGFQRRNFLGEWILCNTSLSSPDECPVTEIVPEQQVFIPTTNGGTIPYELLYAVRKRGDRTYLDWTFTGGTQFRHKYYPPLTRSGQYGVEQDRFTDPYIRVYSRQEESLTSYIKNGQLTAIDPGMTWKSALVKVFDVTDLPVSGTLALPTDFIPAQVAFGYARLDARGYTLQAGGPTEFTFTLDGKYLGENLHSEVLELLSPADKAAVRMIPETCYDYPAVRHHFETNHYFAEYEPITLTLRLNRFPLEYLRAEAELQDVYAVPMEALEPIWAENQITVTHSPLPIGVYRIEFRLFRGEKLIRTVNHAFEVFDSTGKRCAPLESGLPFLYSTPNEQRYLDRDDFDPWNPMPSCDLEHYYPCSCFTGVYGEQKRVWEILPLFGRKWYVWLTDRTMNEHEVENHKDLIRGADYLITDCLNRTYNLRSDYWRADNYKGELLETLCEFLKYHPAVAEKMPWKPGEPFTRDALRVLLQECPASWYAFATDKMLEIVKAENNRLEAIHPEVKRACYGPFSIYVTSTLSYYVVRRFGYPTDKRLTDTVFTGFAQFEDYPVSCAYQTYRGAFAAMSIHLYVPTLRLYPEQYRSSLGGCIDGAVKFANPPFGKRTVPRYFQLTHAYEYVWNTPSFTADGFDYLRDYGFMKRDFSQEELDVFTRGWRIVNEHSPRRPLRGAAFITDFDPSDDRVLDDPFSENWLNVYNISEDNAGFLYEILRKSGIAGGFALKWDAVEALTSADTDLIILPSVANAPKSALQKLRDLSREGVSLFALSDVTGLEDLFGVEKYEQTLNIQSLTDADGKTEAVCPFSVEFHYRPTTAQTLISADGTPALLIHNRTALWNAAVSTLGRDTFAQKVAYDRECVSVLLRRAATKAINLLSTPILQAFPIENAENHCGLTLFEDINGRTMLLAIDYTPYTRTEPEEILTTTRVVFRKPCRDVIAQNGGSCNRLYGKNGVEAVEFTLRQHESALFELLP